MWPNIPITPNHRFFESSCLAQPGCSGTPPFGKKSAWPRGHGKPKTPPSVWMTSTNFASVALNRADGLLNMYSGKAGSRPFRPYRIDAMCNFGSAVIEKRKRKCTKLLELTSIRMQCAMQSTLHSNRWRSTKFRSCWFPHVVTTSPTNQNRTRNKNPQFPLRELTSYPWQFKVPFFERFTSKTGYFGAQTESNQMNALHIDTVFDQEPNETGQIACDSWHISYGVYVPIPRSICGQNIRR